LILVLYFAEYLPKLYHNPTSHNSTHGSCVIYVEENSCTDGKTKYFV